ncbi:MAG: hypothetical protein IPG71_13730 [bacterium]|nr:hypothetical protein [bacterium]
MANLEQVRFVTEQYYELQGLRWVIWGFVCIAIALEDIGVIPKAALLLAVLPLGMAGFIGVTAWYMRRYGTVVGAKRGYGPYAWSLLAIPALIGGMLIDKYLGARPLVMPFMFALWFLVQFWMVGRKWRAHYLVIALLIGLANLLIGLSAWPEGSPLLNRTFVPWMLAGLAMIAGGWLDDALIARTLCGKAAQDVGTV